LPANGGEGGGQGGSGIEAIASVKERAGAPAGIDVGFEDGDVDACAGEDD
jgi:hypothetical protein